MTFGAESFQSLDVQHSFLLKWAENPQKIGMWVAEMDFGIAPNIKAAINEVVNRGEIGYPARKYQTQTVNAGRTWYAQNAGLDSDMFASEQFAVAAGVLDFYRAALLAWTKPGDKIVVPTPAYSPFLSIAKKWDREVVELPAFCALGTTTLDLEEIERVFAEGARFFVLCNPWNPLGRVLTRQELEDLAALCSRFEVKVFADEIHCPLVLEGQHTSFASLNYPSSEHCLTAFSASKGWNLAGSHCSIGILPPGKLGQQVRDALDKLGAHPSILGLVASEAAFNEAESQQWRAQAIYQIKNNFALLDSWVRSRSDISLARLEGTYIAWLDFKRLRNSEGIRISQMQSPAAYFADKAGVVLSAGEHCGKTYRSCARMIIASPREVLEQALERMDAALR